MAVVLVAVLLLLLLLLLCLPGLLAGLVWEREMSEREARRRPPMSERCAMWPESGEMQNIRKKKERAKQSKPRRKP